jgi:hypothetical protein
MIICEARRPDQPRIAPSSGGLGLSNVAPQQLPMSETQVLSYNVIIGQTLQLHAAGGR